VADNGERQETQRLHYLDLIRGHGALGVRRVVLAAEGLGAVAVAPQVRGDHSEVLSEPGGDRVPHRVRLRVAVEQQHGRPLAPTDEVDLGVAGPYSDPLEGFEHAR
jgi:hypothetical protein